MRSLRVFKFPPLFFLLFLVLFWGCETGASEEKTEEPAEEANEERLAGDAEDDAEYLTEAYSFGLMVKAYNEVALAKTNTPAYATELANTLNEFQRDFNGSIEQLAKGQITGVVLPKELGENVLDYIENLQKEDDPDDFAEEYLDVLEDIFDRLEDTVEDAAEDGSNSALRSWGQQKLQDVRSWQQRIEDAEDTADATG